MVGFATENPTVSAAKTNRTASVRFWQLLVIFHSPLSPPAPPRTRTGFVTEDCVSVFLGCIGWRQTGNCVATGPREAHNDEPCSTVILSGKASDSVLRLGCSVFGSTLEFAFVCVGALRPVGLLRVYRHKCAAELWPRLCYVHRPLFRFVHACKLSPIYYQPDVWCQTTSLRFDLASFGP